MLQLVGKSERPEGDSQQERNRIRRFQLANLLRSTEEILNHAQNGNWEFVEELEKARKNDLLACFSENYIDESPRIAEALASLIYMNEEIMALVVHAKNETMVASQSHNHGKNAMKSYLSNYGCGA